MTSAVLTALLTGAATLACAPTLAQASRGSGAAAAPAPAAATRSSSNPVYRVELVIFRATSTLGSPEDWAAESGTAPAASTDEDPAAAEPAQSQSDQAENGQPRGGAQGAPRSGSTQSSPPASGAPPNGGQSSSAPSDGAPSGSDPPSSAPPDIVVRLLPSSAFQLDSVASRLRASGRYVPVAHIAWEQDASPWGRPVEVPVHSIGLDAPDVTGTVALERGQFLHLALDLRYAMSDPPPGLDAPPGTVFVLHQSHRVRLRESSYFDHPAFGVIAIVTLDKSGHAPPR